jgi:hypothetical protein
MFVICGLSDGSSASRIPREIRSFAIGGRLQPARMPCASIFFWTQQQKKAQASFFSPTVSAPVAKAMTTSETPAALLDQPAS